MKQEIYNIIGSMGSELFSEPIDPNTSVEGRRLLETFADKEVIEGELIHATNDTNLIPMGCYSYNSQGRPVLIGGRRG